MLFPAMTARYAAVFGVLFVALSGWIVLLRLRTGTLHGSEPSSRLGRAARAQANFIEYVPLILIMVALLDMGGAKGWQLHLLLVPLLIARLAHPFGMLAPVGSIRQYLCRGVPAAVTLLVLLAASVLLFLRGL